MKNTWSENSVAIAQINFSRLAAICLAGWLGLSTGLSAANQEPWANSSASAFHSPSVFILDQRQLLETKRRLHAGEASLTLSFKKLRGDADRALSLVAPSVVHKEKLPPSGDKHDYMSTAPYWWPNPNTPSGLPYLRRDGEVNPKRDRSSDRKRLDNLVESVKTLALGYFLTGREDYAAHAAKLLRVWFLDEATRMNPHLRYGQAIPGQNVGRAAGIIETHNLPEVIDAVGLLAGSKSWSAEDHRGLQKWFDAYLAWLRESPEGREEAQAPNNHGSWYDVQITACALFVDKSDIAKSRLSEMAKTRIATQIEPDGSQPRELERSLAWSYSLFNVKALFNGAAMASKLGIDLWSYESPDKRSIRQAFDWLVPFATGEKKWTHQQISGLQLERLAPFLRRAAFYEKILGRIPKLTGDEPWQLLYTKIPEAR